ncbi:MAG: hypothetical protein KDF65_04740, partial [Anaerolineae bacterium]|nr:hypothetical protein [Anaerolineae bacterium]
QFIPWGTPSPAEAFAYEVTSGAIGTTSTGEFLPRWALQHPQPDTLWPDYAAGRPPQRLDPATLPAGASVETISHLAEADRLHIETPQSFQATLRTLYWPGWQLYLNDAPHEFRITPQTGLIQTTIPAGQHTLTLQLESTPLRTIGRWLSLGSFFGLILIVGFTLKRRPSIAPTTDYQLPTTDYWSLSPRLFIVTTALLIAAYLLSRPLAPLLVRQSDPNRPIPADELVQVDFSHQLRLVGLDSLPQTITLAEDRPTDLFVVAYWRAVQELQTNYAVFAHLDAPNGQTIATVDEVHPENIPTRNWPPGLYLRNPLHLEIPPDAPPIRYDLNLGVYNRESGERLAIGPAQTTFTAGSLWLLPATAAPVTGPAARFGLAVTLHQPSLAGDSLTLVWQTEQPLPPNLTLFIHLLDANGELLGQLDGPPYAGLYPLENWLPGQPITDQRPLPVLNEPGRLSAVAIGVYDLDSGTRLPALDAQGQPLPNDSFILPVPASP